MNSVMGVADPGVWSRVLTGSSSFHASPSTDFLSGYAGPMGASFLWTLARTRTPVLDIPKSAEPSDGHEV